MDAPYLQVNLPLMSAIVPVYGERGIPFTRKCVESMKRTHSHFPHLEVFVIEDASKGDNVTAEYAKIAEQNECYFVSLSEHCGYAKACNAGLEHANGEVVFLVNNDVEFVEPTLHVLMDACIQTVSGVVGCRLLYPDRRIQHGGVYFQPTEGGDIPGYFDHISRFMHEHDMNAMVMARRLVTGALFGVTRWAIDTVGLMDERFGFTAEDIDYSLKVIEGGRHPLYVGYTAAIHHEGRTRGTTLEEKQQLAPDIAEREQESLRFLFRKWHGIKWDKFGVLYG